MAASAINSENTVKKIYHTVIDEVITNIREAFLDEGYDEQLLQEMKHMWEAKLNSSRAIQSSDDLNTTPPFPTSSAANSSTLRLPTQPPTPRSNPGSVNVQSKHSNQQNMPIIDLSVDVKPNMQYLDPHTKAGIHTAYGMNLGHSSSNTQDQNRIKKQLAGQLDGHGIDGGSSSEEDEDDDEIGVPNDEDDDADDKTNNDDQNDYEGKEDSDPLNSNDDLTDPGSPDSQSDLFDTEHVIVCQYDKITRIKNKWKFHLKDGIMNINGKDYLFSKANGDAEW